MLEAAAACGLPLHRKTSILAPRKGPILAMEPLAPKIGDAAARVVLIPIERDRLRCAGSIHWGNNQDKPR
jgi:hypothetical protein